MYLQHAFKGKNDWWRYVLSSIIVICAYFLAQLPISLIVLFKATENNDGANIAQYINPVALGMSQNAYLLLFIAPLILVLGTVVMCMKVLHWQTLQGVFTSFGKFRWRNYFIAAFVWFLMLIIFDSISYFMHNETFELQFHAKDFIVLLAICIVFVPIQTAWEELYFRGNLMQGFGILFKYRYIALIITSVLFGLVHISNPEVQKFGVPAAMAQYIGFGLFLGILVIMDGGMEAALGIHAMNNFYSLTLVSYSGSVLDSPSLITKTDNDIAFSVMALLLAAIITLLIMKRLFKWQSFSWLFTKVSR